MLVQEAPEVDAWTGDPLSDPPRSILRNPYLGYYYSMHEQIRKTVDSSSPMCALRSAGGID